MISIDETNKEIIEEIKILEVDCPACASIEDEQYTCTICWCQGGNGKINTYEFLLKYWKVTNVTLDL